MSSVDDEHGPVSADPDSSTMQAEIEQDWLAIFSRGDQLAAILEDFGLRPYSWQDQQTYRDLRRELVRSLRGLVAVKDVMYGKPSDASFYLVPRLVDETFPSTLSNRFSLSSWRRIQWGKLSDFVLTIFEAIGFDPTASVETVPEGDDHAFGVSSNVLESPRDPYGHGRPRGRAKRSAEDYRDHYQDLRRVLSRQPKELEFLRYVIFIEEWSQLRRPTPREIEECVTDPKAKKLDRKTLMRNLGPEGVWPWEMFINWASAADAGTT